LTDQMAHTKFIFDQWHTGSKRFRVATAKDSQLQQCPCCREDLKTTRHVLQCTKNPSRDQTIQEFRRRMSSAEHHPVYHLLKECVVAWLDGSAFNPPVLEYPTHLQDQLRMAVHDQEQIGWDNALKGYLSMEWRALAETSLYDRPTDTQDGKGISMLRGIMQTFHTLSQQLWKARNHVLHESNETELRNIRDIEAAEIRALHSRPELIQAGDRHYCERTLDTVLQKAPSSRRRWLRYMRMARSRISTFIYRQVTTVLGYDGTGTGFSFS
jgi:hypothetical protein